ncbi:MAG: FKBP-type peptidyl-prolyl cis-trans isomerase [Myxococcales bacterium]|nr:FKBP-type peptidyl-prolyl cis-trans isomerase [Myxococcales bacterium]
MNARALRGLCPVPALVLLGCVGTGPNLEGLGHSPQAERAKALDPAFATPPPDAERFASGVAKTTLRPGTGTLMPDPGSLVRVEFEGFRANGTLFDSSKRKGKPQIFELSETVRGLSEALTHMVEGEVARFWIPGHLAYGDKPEDPRLPAGPLVFELELLKIVRR